MSYTDRVSPFGLGLAGALLALSAWLAVFRRRSVLDHGWRSAARQLGLTYVPPSFFRSPRLFGRVGGCAVHVDITNPRGSDHLDHVMTRVTVAAPNVPADFSVEPRSFWRRVAPAWWATEGRVGERSFDQRVKIDGDPTYALAVLEPDIRERLQQLTSLQGTIQNGELQIVLRGRVRRGPRLVKLVDFLVDLAGALSIDQSDWAAALRERATQDPSAEVRLRSLETLIAHFPDAIETRRAVRDRLGDFIPEIQLVAARHAGREGIAVAAEIFQDHAVTPAVRGRALGTWAALAPRPDRELRYGLRNGRSTDSDTMVRVGALVVANRREQGLRSLVLKALDDGPAAVQSAALAALGTTGNREDLHRVVPFLRARDPDIRVAAVEAAGRLGDRETIEPLMRIARSLTQPNRVKVAARAAVRGIQRRMGGERGGLAVIDERSAGAVSEAIEGALSTPSVHDSDEADAGRVEPDHSAR